MGGGGGGGGGEGFRKSKWFIIYFIRAVMSLMCH